jgi:hypothetical protein
MQETADNFLEGLSVALVHPYLSTHPQVLCAAARVCKDWRQAVLQCNARNIMVQLHVEDQLPQLNSFLQWLARHSGLLAGLSLYTCVDELPLNWQLVAAQQLLQQGLHAAATQLQTAGSSPAAAPVPAAAAMAAITAASVQDMHPAPLIAAAAAAADAAAEGSTIQADATNAEAEAGSPEAGQLQPRQGLHLRSFSSNLPTAVDILAALHLDSLTHLQLNLEAAKTNSAALADAFARLKNLQKLRLHNMRRGRLGIAFPALAQLGQLTSLEFSGDWPVDPESAGFPGSPAGLAKRTAAALQQLLSQALPLQELRLGFEGYFQLPLLDTSHLTKLTLLSTGRCQVPAQSVLPAQVQWLEFSSWLTADSLAPVTRLQLKQLKHLSLTNHSTQLQPLLQLAQLPALQHLALQYESAPFYYHLLTVGATAAATASAWAVLPQLQQLNLRLHLPSEAEWTAILAGIAAATSLTKLELKVCHAASVAPQWAVNVSACPSFTSLPALQDLTLRYGGWFCVGMQLAPADAQALTLLTNLTRLDFTDAGQGVGAAAATALACSLTQLRHLCLGQCHLKLGSEGMACLEAIARLTQLTYLNSMDNSHLTQEGLMLLMKLPYLQPENFKHGFWLEMLVHGSASTWEDVMSEEQEQDDEGQQ